MLSLLFRKRHVQPLEESALLYDPEMQVNLV